MPPAAALLNLTVIRQEALRLGFADVSIAGFAGLPQAAEKLNQWLANHMHGSMDFLQRNAPLRADPSQLLDKACCALLLRMDYLSNPVQQIQQSQRLLNQASTAQISLYAQGRDYHTVLRHRLKKLLSFLQYHAPNEHFRVFTDSAPVMEVELAQAAGLGWRGKHTLLINRDSGSTFFLGGILSTLDLSQLPVPQAGQDKPSGQCGTCTACITVCPTQAIVAPYVVDARLCISYLTIESDESTPVALRPLIGNRIYGCDDCQTACPWNKFATASTVDDFLPRNGLEQGALLELWGWTEAVFLRRLEGSPIRRIGHARWLRNIATALGNALAAQPSADETIVIQQALAQHSQHPHFAVREHVAWALAQSPS
jgi:epoxyqueuosine reductase